MLKLESVCRTGRYIVYASAGLLAAAGGLPRPAYAVISPNCQSVGVGAPEADQSKFKILDDMDFNIYSNQLWDRINESHTDDIFVQNADRTTTKGLPPHIGTMKFVASFIPDARVTGHPVCVASGDWTAMIGVFEGTFGKPLQTAAGQPPIPPTGKTFRIQMSTISHWREGLMDQEYLFWDNANLSRQMGMTPGPVTPQQDAGPVPQSGVDDRIGKAEIARRLTALDTADSAVWNRREWDKLSQTQAQDVTISMPDGRVVTGLSDYIADTKRLVAWAPDARVTKHPIAFGQGDWTVVVRQIEGTFSAPMSDPTGGAPIPPTGKRFTFQMASYSHWNDAGKVDRDYQFWDSEALMQQIGVGK